jgi:exopolysaccharide production protein ExoY
MKFAAGHIVTGSQAEIHTELCDSIARDIGRPVEPVGGLIKRCFDLVAAVIAIIALAPLLIGFAILVRASSPGPVLYGHKRVGFGGKSFKCWKFRTMVVNGDVVLDRCLRDNPEMRKEWAETQKLRDDPRVTPVGRVLRKLSIDELPQLFNIVMGDMSIVGPRPIVTDETRRYGLSLGHYLRARPGLTGLWQVSGRSDTGYRQRIILDRCYASNWSILCDIGIILRTIPAVLRSSGSY